MASQSHSNPFLSSSSETSIDDSIAPALPRASSLDPQEPSQVEVPSSDERPQKLTLFQKAKSWMDTHPVQYELENKGSVARDHLANERTYLAWLRTSLSLASIGVAITQLFRLSSSIYTVPDEPNPSSSLTFADSSSTPLPYISEQDQQAQIALLAAQIEAQYEQMHIIGALVAKDKWTYRYLGKPLGALFVGLGLIFLVLGTVRYFKVQYFLVNGNKFPPSRKGVFFSTFLVAATVLASFVGVLAFHSKDRSVRK